MTRLRARRGARLGGREGRFWGDKEGGDSSALPKGAQLHHVLLLESLWGFGPQSEQLGCSWLCGGGGGREGVKSGCSRNPVSPLPAAWGEVGANLDDADGFSGEVVAGVAEEGQHQRQSPVPAGSSERRGVRVGGVTGMGGLSPSQLGKPTPAGMSWTSPASALAVLFFPPLKYS